MKNEVILGSAYLAPVEYYTKLFAYPSVCVERYDHYMKQTYRNRCVIASADGPLALTIPTEKSDDLKCVMKDMQGKCIFILSIMVLMLLLSSPV